MSPLSPDRTARADSHLADELLARSALADTCFKSYWLDCLPQEPPAAPLQQDIRCDLLVVGGGFCGLWGAVLAKEQSPDRDVVLIEGATIANGASGRPAAIVSTSVMHGIDNTQRLFPDAVEDLEQLGRDNIDALIATIERYSIHCDLELGGEMKVSIGDDGLHVVHEEYQLYQRYGHTAQLLDKSAVQAQINSPLFHGAVWSTKRSGTLHPGKLARELKRVARQLGVLIYEGTMHTGNRQLGDHVLVHTSGGKITADKVLLATNAYAVGHRHIRRKVVAVRDRIVVTEPLSDEQMALVGWHNRQGIYDTRTQLNYLRLTADNRILFGGRLGYFYNDNTDPAADKTAMPYIRLAQAFYKTFPQLASQVKFSHAWSGPIGLTTRMAVHYQQYYGGKMIFAGGYSGFGVTATRFGARIALALLDKQDIPEARMAFAKTQPAYVPPEPLRWLGAKITLYALDTVDEKGGWRKPWIALVHKLGFPIVL